MNNSSKGKVLPKSLLVQPRIAGKGDVIRNTPAKRPSASEPSHAEQDYLKALHHLGGTEQRVATTQIAELLKVRAPSVTGMLGRLQAAGWIIYKKHCGAQLTTRGTMEARRVIRRHRLLKVLLTQTLGFDWSEVEAEAEALEHAVSPRLEQALAAFLGEPVEDPHGHPIPTGKGDLRERQLQPLCMFRAGQSVIIREAEDDDPERLNHWQALGLLPGITVHFLSYQPLDDVFQLQIGHKIVSLGSEGLAGLHGETSATSEVKQAA